MERCMFLATIADGENSCFTGRREEQLQRLTLSPLLDGSQSVSSLSRLCASYMLTSCYIMSSNYSTCSFFDNIYSFMSCSNATTTTTTTTTTIFSSSSSSSSSSFFFFIFSLFLHVFSSLFSLLRFCFTTRPFPVYSTTKMPLVRPIDVLSKDEIEP